VYTTEKFLSENSEKIPDELKTEVEADLESLKKTLEEEDVDKDALDAAVAKLGESSQKMGAAMYAAGESEAAAAGGTTGTGDGDEDVVDAEIVDDADEESDEGENK
jgi:molecular chaperone DnaK